MVRNPQTYNNEVNFIELIKTVWEGKWKIAVAVVTSIIAMTIYQSIKIKNFHVVTEIKPISTLIINEYIVLNNIVTLNESEAAEWKKDSIAENQTEIKNIRFQKITKSKLLNLYLEVLEEKTLFEDAIRKFNILDASQYSDEQIYNEAIIQLASSIKILTPSGNPNNGQRKGSSEVSYHTINFKIDDFEKWKNVLIHVDELANQLVKKSLFEDYNRLFIVSKNLKKYAIANLKLQKENKIEDLSIEINNLLDDYDRNISDRLSYLREQAEMAKELGISNNTFETQTYTTQSGILTNIKTNTPFYFRGSKAIEKEIDLITSRTDKKAFVENLSELEQSLRDVKQDKTIERLEKKNDSLDLLKEVLQLSPLGDGNEFNSSSINVLATKVIDNDNSNQMLSLAILIGLLFGVFYVLITNELKYYKVKKK
jgi:LPS O-antigen subunit length determinant protein (WzzB/FepE family)